MPAPCLAAMRLPADRLPAPHPSPITHQRRPPARFRSWPTAHRRPRRQRRRTRPHCPRHAPHTGVPSCRGLLHLPRAHRPAAMPPATARPPRPSLSRVSFAGSRGRGCRGLSPAQHPRGLFLATELAIRVGSRGCRSNSSHDRRSVGSGSRRQQWRRQRGGGGGTLGTLSAQPGPRTADTAPGRPLLPLQASKLLSSPRGSALCCPVPWTDHLTCRAASVGAGARQDHGLHAASQAATAALAARPAAAAAAGTPCHPPTRAPVGMCMRPADFCNPGHFCAGQACAPGMLSGAQIAAMVQHLRGDGPAAQLAAVKAPWRLAHVSAESHAAVAGVGGIEAAVPRLSSAANEVQYHAAALLAKLADESPERSAAILAAHGMPTLVPLLHSTNEHVVEAGAAAVRYTADAGGAAACAAAVHAGALQLLAAALQLSSNTDVLLHSAVAVANHLAVLQQQQQPTQRLPLCAAWQLPRAFSRVPQSPPCFGSVLTRSATQRLLLLAASRHSLVFWRV